MPSEKETLKACDMSLCFTTLPNRVRVTNNGVAAEGQVELLEHGVGQLQVELCELPVNDLNDGLVDLRQSAAERNLQGHSEACACNREDKCVLLHLVLFLLL